MLKRRKIVWQNLINQFTYLSLGTQLNIFQWMLKTGWEYRNENNGVFEWLYGMSGWGAQKYNNEYGFQKHGSDILTDLHMAFVRAIVDSEPDPYDPVLAWREHCGIGLQKPYRMLPVVDYEHSLRAHNNLFWFTGQALQVSLNSCYPQARHIRSVCLTPSNHGWQVILRYGQDDNRRVPQSYEPLLEHRVESAGLAVELAIAQLTEWCSPEKRTR